MSERPLAVLDALGEELRRLGEPPRSHPRFTRRTLLIAAVLALLLAGVAAATILITRGPPLPAPNASDLQSSGVPLPATVRLAGLDAVDPDPAQPPWDIRLSRTRAGETCTAVGQVLDGQFGIVGLDHVFRTLPLGGVDACGADAPEGPILAGARVFVGASLQDPRTVVNGVAGNGARSVTVYGPDGARAMRLGQQGSFITVYRGYVEEVRPRVVVVTRDGHRHAIAFAQSSAFEVADPGGGSPWEVSGNADLEPHAYPDENCAQASQELGRTDPNRFDASLTPEVCGRLGQQPLFVLMRRFVPGSGEHTGFPWGNNPARTLVYGAAAPRVATLTLTGAGPARTLAIDPRGGVFLAVLDGRVDPRALTLTARLRDGHTLAYTHSSNLLDFMRARPLPEPPVPAYRAPLPASRNLPVPFELPVAGTVRETLRAADPAGAGTWLLRSWQGRPNPRANFGGRVPSERFICMQVGLARGPTLLEPRASGPAQPLEVRDESGRCNEPRDLARLTYMLQVESYLADAFSYQPRPARTVLSGELPLGASDAVMLGAGSPRRLRLDANHAFLLVLPGRYWRASPHITYRLNGRTVGTLTGPRFPLGAAPTTPQARAPDPDGGAPWGFSATADCSSAIGRVVEEQLASIDELNGVLKSGADITGGGGSCPTHPQPLLPEAERRRPVSFDVQQADLYTGLPGANARPLTPPQIERRTLPGRTIIAGVARADVSSVTLATPRDVRTLRPSGPLHTIIVVYDGQFFRGAITATVQLRDGRMVTEPVPNGPGGIGASPPPTPSLATRLRSDQITLERMRRQVASAEHASPGQRARLLHGAPLALLEQGLRAIRSIVATEKARIAFLRAHPGVLPSE